MLRQIISPEFTIRLAVTDDCQELASVKRKVWESTYRGIYPDAKIDNFDVKVQAEKFLKIITNPDIKLFVAVNRGKIVGYMSCGAPIRPYKDYEQEIGLLYVLKDHQGMGIGKAFFELATKEIREGGYEEFFISCNKFNANARNFYEYMGGKLVSVDDDKADKSEVQVKYHYNVKKEAL